MTWTSRLNDTRGPPLALTAGGWTDAVADVTVLDCWCWDWWAGADITADDEPEAGVDADVGGACAW